MSTTTGALVLLYVIVIVGLFRGDWHERRIDRLEKKLRD
jgi:hypothetical protein